VRNGKHTSFSYFEFLNHNVISESYVQRALIKLVRRKSCTSECGEIAS